MRRVLAPLLGIAAAVLMASAPSALAGTANVSVVGSKLYVLAAASSASAANAITVTKEASTYKVTENVSGAILAPGSDCSYSSPPSLTAVTCQPESTVASIFVDVRNGNNSVRIVGNTPSEVHSGDGLDSLIGGDGTDKLYGGGGIDGLSSGKGDYDELYGEGGDDFLEFNFGGGYEGRVGNGKVYDGGAGLDQWAGFSARVKPSGTTFIDLRDVYQVPRPDSSLFPAMGRAFTQGPYFDSSGGSVSELHGLRSIESVFGTDGDDLLWGQLDEHDESFYGLGGADHFHTSPGDDRYICGHFSGIRTQAPDGRDTVDYGSAEGTVRITLGGQADDGQPGEYDTVFDCDAFIGGPGTLTVQGNGGNNVIDVQGSGPIDVHGNGGNDTLSSSSHGVLYGDAGNDALSRGEQLHGGEGDDVLVDGVWLLGGPGNDAMVGGARNSIFFENPGEGTDTFLAGLPEFGIPFGGPDAYLTRDGVREIVACGDPSYVLRIPGSPVDTPAVGPPNWGDVDDDYRDCF